MPTINIPLPHTRPENGIPKADEFTTIDQEMARRFEHAHPEVANEPEKPKESDSKDSD